MPMLVDRLAGPPRSSCRPPHRIPRAGWRAHGDGDEEQLTRVLRGVGWTLIAAGVLILLYLVYIVFYTTLRTDRAQDELLQEWRLEYGMLPGEAAGSYAAPRASRAAPVRPGSAYAALWFERPGSDRRPVHDEVLFLVDGVDRDDLERGPGHYPSTDPPGHAGNFAVSGHRTTYGAPFYHLDQLRPGDRVHVVDRLNRRWVYVVRRAQVVAPNDVWVLEDDPLGSGTPTMTLTTCHPRFSAAERLVVFAELQGTPAPRI